MPESRVSISRPYRVALPRSPCWAGGDPGGRFGTLAAEVSQKRRRFACRYLGRGIWKADLYGFINFYVPKRMKNGDFIRFWEITARSRTAL